MTIRTCIRLGLIAGCLVVPGQALRAETADAGTTNPGAAKAHRPSTSDDDKTDMKAKDLLNKGVELLPQSQSEERGIKMIQSIPQLYPKSKIRYQAWMALGRFYIDKHLFDLAIKQFEQIETSDSPEELAESLYRTGICYFSTDNLDKAFSCLRKVTNQYPWSIFANEAYYYIGQCHFKQHRWTNAVDALEMVGTSVPLNKTTDARAESGQRLFVKLHDQDLVVLLHNGQHPKVKLTSSTGDTETVTLDAIGRDGDYFLGSIQTVPGKAVPGDNLMQVVAGTTVSVDYDDENTESGQRHVKRLAQVQMVSTATLGFTDGAYQDYVHGVNGDGEAFIRVRDLDRDTSDNPDAITLKLTSQWKEKRSEDASKGIMLDEQEEVLHERDHLDVKLTETGPHTGIFTGQVHVELIQPNGHKSGAGVTIGACSGDDLIMEYVDELNLSGEAKTVKASARVLTGKMSDVTSTNHILSDLDQRARKDLIEGELNLRLAQIFREVGLVTKAVAKAELGHAKVDEVIKQSEKASLSREIVEEAYTVKWELFIAQDKLRDAINICNELIRRFPDSTLVDHALLKIGQAKLASKDTEGALSVLGSILQMPKSDCKAEAQLTIAKVLEERALKNPAMMAQAMMAYKKVSDYYPDSPFAGEALDKIANFYISTQDYARAIEMMEQVVTEYEDAKFLDGVYFHWVIAAYRSGRYQMARDKLNELLSRYPNSSYAQQAKDFSSMIDKKLGGGSSETSGDGK